MTGKYFLVDTTRCTACRGCQIACKAVKGLRADRTKQWGNYQNPPDLDARTYRLVRFSEHDAPGNTAVWYFFTDACRHCLEPPCKDEADKYVPGAIVVDPSGAVIYTDKIGRLGDKAESVRQECPYNVPRLDPKTGRLTKCDMCFDRVRQGLLPACAQACPNGALIFGPAEDIALLAGRRLARAKKKFGDRARLLNPDEVRAVYLIVDEPEKYYEYATY